MSSKKILKLKVIYGEKYLKYQTNRGWIREKVRQVYLHHIRNYLEGLTIDFGCGVGEMLKLLPPGSLGLEVNTATVKYCNKHHLNVELYSPDKDNYLFKNIRRGEYSSFSMCHVLEHIEGASDIFKKIMKACQRMGIEKIVLVVPGHKGFLSDNSHKTFVDYDYLENHDLTVLYGYRLKKIEYFPINIKIVGNWLIHNESIFVYEKR